MKRLLLSLTAITMAAALTACGERTSSRSGTAAAVPSQEAALETFRAEFSEIRQWMRVNRPDSSSPVQTAVSIKRAAAKMKSVKTGGLPADLKAAWEKLAATADSIAVLVKDSPEDENGFLQFVTGQARKDPGYGPGLAAAGKEFSEAPAVFYQTGRKYGIHPGGE